MKKFANEQRVKTVEFYYLSAKSITQTQKNFTIILMFKNHHQKT